MEGPPFIPTWHAPHVWDYSKGFTWITHLVITRNQWCRYYYYPDFRKERRHWEVKWLTQGHMFCKQQSRHLSPSYQPCHPSASHLTLSAMIYASQPDFIPRHPLIHQHLPLSPSQHHELLGTKNTSYICACIPDNVWLAQIGWIIHLLTLLQNNFRVIPWSKSMLG